MVKAFGFCINLRYAPNETFYQGKLYRYPVRNKYPVLQLNCAVGSKSINNDYNYLRLQMSVSKRFYASILGYGDTTFEADKIIVKVIISTGIIKISLKSKSIFKFSHFNTIINFSNNVQKVNFADWLRLQEESEDVQQE
jgi:hypothetical protein